MAALRRAYATVLGIIVDDKPESLPAGDYNSDLHVVGPWVADRKLGKGTYKYHGVHIHHQGTLSRTGETENLPMSFRLFDFGLHLWADSSGKKGASVALTVTRPRPRGQSGKRSATARR